MAGVLLRLLLGLCLAGPVQAATPWTAYFGTHYELADWSSSLRDPGGPGRFGYWLPSARTERRMTSADSGSPEELRRLLARGDVVLNVGGLGSARDGDLVSAFLDAVRQDRGATWKRELAERARRVARLPGTAEHIHWQFGNEINGPRSVDNMARWAGGSRTGLETGLAAVIPVYVEQFLAPGVEALRGVSREVHGDPQHIRIMLGSLANARHPRSVRWYEQLLDYTIRGDNAPSLAGRKVHEVVDALSVHYLASAPDEGWAEVLEGLNKRWVGKGAVRRIWATEELGVRRAQGGYGAATALRVAVRYLDWWQRHGWTPDQGHCFFWGAGMGRPGNRADDALSLLAGFTGHVPLTPLSALDSPDLESYFFSVEGDRKRFLVVFPRNGWRMGNLDFASATLPASGWQGPVRARALLFASSGTSHPSATVSASAAGLRLALERSTAIPETGTLLFLLERD